MALSPDGKWLAAGGVAGTHRRHREDIAAYPPLRVRERQARGAVEGAYECGQGLAFSPDGSRLISGSARQCRHPLGHRDTSRRRVAEPKLLHRLEGHKAEIYAVGFSPDGSRAVTGSLDHDLRLWRVDDGKEIAHMTGHGDKVLSLALAPDGTIASGDASGEIRLWDLARWALFAHVGQAKERNWCASFLPGRKAFAYSAAASGGGVATSRKISTTFASGKEISPIVPRQYRARHGLQPGRALGGDRRRRQRGDPPLGPAYGQAPAGSRWQAVAARRPGAGGLRSGVLGRWPAHRLGEYRLSGTVNSRTEPLRAGFDSAAGRGRAWRACCPCRGGGRRLPPRAGQLWRLLA